MKNRTIAVIIFFIITGILAAFTSGCTPVNVYRYNDFEYRPIDVIDIYERPPRVYVHEIAYIPKFRPMKLYHFNGMWYDEPYTRMLYQDVNGRVRPRRIPRSIIREIDKRMKIRRPYRRQPEEISPDKMKRKKRKDLRLPEGIPNRNFYNDRRKNRIIIKRRQTVGS